MISFLDKNRSISLYIHIPFCKKKCDYCAFYSLEKYNNDLIKTYISLIKEKIKKLNNFINKAWYTVFIGGGNPGLLSYSILNEIIELIKENGEIKEITIELNPESINEEISLLIKNGVRISVGIQSLDQKALNVLGRNTSVHASMKALEILKANEANFNVDLITSIPSMNVETTLKDIEIVDSFKPNHISLYDLTFEEGTKLIKREKRLKEEESVSNLLISWEKLKDLGFEHYEISNFAKKGFECKHNKVYWNLGQYIGIGPTAESLLGYKETITLRNQENLNSFLNNQNFISEKNSVSQTKELFLLTNLRTKEGINKHEYNKRFTCSFDLDFSKRIESIDPDLYTNDSSFFRINEKGFLILDNIILNLALAI